jgi:hypothetical protein
MQGKEKQKRVFTTFDKVRITLRVIGSICGAVPIIAYSVFAIAFQRIQVDRNYETSTVTVIKDQAYEISQIALPIANFGWTYLLPIFAPIAIFDIIVALRRQYVDGERKLY